MTEHELAVRRHYCETHPGVYVDLLAEELLQLIDEREDRGRLLKALQEHLERRHGCRGDCREAGT